MKSLNTMLFGGFLGGLSAIAGWPVVTWQFWVIIIIGNGLFFWRVYLEQKS